MTDQSLYILNRSKQTIYVEGQSYSPQEIGKIFSGTQERYQPVIKELCSFLEDWFAEDPYITVQTSGSTGEPKQMKVSKDRMMHSARMTCSWLGLYKGDRALLCMPLQYIGGKMMVVRALIAGLDLWVRPASGHPLKELSVPIRFAAMVPLQVYNTLQIPEEKQRLENIHTLLIGGSAIDHSLEKELTTFPNRIYSTYGMTETLSHIALRQLNGADTSEAYTPFPSVSLTTDKEGCLQIDAPAISETIIRTHDIADILPDERFIIRGRKDNIINTGGVKVQIEEVERKLASLLSSPFAITSIPDIKFGERIILLTTDPEEVKNQQQKIQNLLPKYHQPTTILPTSQIPMAGNGKTDRRRCKEIALAQTGTNPE